MDISNFIKEGNSKIEEWGLKATFHLKEASLETVILYENGQGTELDYELFKQGKTMEAAIQTLRDILKQRVGSL